jgi:hypothetical protein
VAFERLSRMTFFAFLFSHFLWRTLKIILLVFLQQKPHQTWMQRFPTWTAWTQWYSCCHFVKSWTHACTVLSY